MQWSGEQGLVGTGLAQLCSLPDEEGGEMCDANKDFHLK